MVSEILELEYGANHLMAFFLMLSLIAIRLPTGAEVSPISLAGDFIQTLVVGLGTG